MSIEDDLCLREVGLKPAEHWTNPGPGLWFILPRTGTGEFVSGAVRRRLCSRVALLANVGAQVTLYSAPQCEFIFRYFRVALETLFPLLTCREISHLRAVTDFLKAGKDYPIDGNPFLQRLSLQEAVPSTVNLEHRSLLLRVVASLLSTEIEAHNGEPFTSASAAQRITQVLGQMSAEQIANSSTGELARKFGCSRRHLNRLFRAQFGISISALKLELRLVKATALLRDPQAKVVAVATDAGFTHLGHFNYHFKRRFGVSPSQWRKTSNASPPQPLPLQVPLHLLSNQHSGSTAGCRAYG